MDAEWCACDERRLLRRLQRATCCAEGWARALEDERAQAVSSEVAVLTGGSFLGHCAARNLDGGVERMWKLLPGQWSILWRTHRRAMLASKENAEFPPLSHGPNLCFSTSSPGVLLTRATPVENSSQG